jgi:hypothetical protein
MVLQSVYFMVKFKIFIPELWDFIHQIVGDFSYVALSIENPLANSLQTSHGYNRNFTIKYTDRKTINSNNPVKFEVNWLRSS